MAFIVSNLDDVRHGDKVFFATSSRLDAEFGCLANHIGISKAVHDGTKSAEIHALGGIG